VSGTASEVDCPRCGATGSVVRGFCQVCDAAQERYLEAADLPPAASALLDPYRLSDVMAELRAISDLVAGAEGSTEIAAALRRTEELLLRLREQFMLDFVLGGRRRSYRARP
jgi:hypothetical protein